MNLDDYFEGWESLGWGSLPFNKKEHYTCETCGETFLAQHTGGPDACPECYP